MCRSRRNTNEPEQCASLATLKPNEPPKPAREKQLMKHQITTEKTKIYDDEEEGQYYSVCIRLSEHDLNRAYEIVALARSLNQHSIYDHVENVLEWAVFKGLSDFLPDMFVEMESSGDITDDQMEALTEYYNAADWNTRQDIINLNKAVL
jgi:hypothetical protein